MTRLARWLSIIAHPFVMVGLLVGAAAARQRNGDVVRSVLVVFLFTSVPLLVLMVRQVRRGAWDNADASNRGERPLLYRVGGIALVALVAYLFFARPPSFLTRGSVGTLGMLGVCAIATRWIKVSLHMAFATLTPVTLILIGSHIGWPLLAVVPALTWARLALGRHTAAEAALGSGIGALTGIVIALA